MQVINQANDGPTILTVKSMLQIVVFLSILKFIVSPIRSALMKILNVNVHPSSRIWAP